MSVPAWQDHIVKSKKLKGRLEKTQRTLLLYVGKAYRSTSLDALQVITSNVPIDLVVQERARRDRDRKTGKRLQRCKTIGEWDSRW